MKTKTHGKSLMRIFDDLDLKEISEIFEIENTAITIEDAIHVADALEEKDERELSDLIKKLIPESNLHFRN